MGRIVGTALAAAGALMLAGCGGGDSTGPTAEENRELNNAAEMLDDSNVTDASADSLTVEEAPVGNGDAAAATGDTLVGGGDNAATNGAAVNAQ